MHIQYNVDLTPFNTFGIAARAKAMAHFSSTEELQALLQNAELAGLPRLVLGGGSNILLTRDWPGVVLLNRIMGIEQVAADSSGVTVRAGAGVVWHDLVMHCVAQGWGGLENLALIPGRVGAAPMQNIGAYGAEIKDCFDHLHALRLSDNSVVRFGPEECAFGYRESYFKRAGKDKYVILDVAFRLSTAPVVDVSYGSIKQELERRGIASPSIRQVSDAVIAIRSSKLPDPLAIGNAGSFFKNPVVSTQQAEALRVQLPDLVTYPVADGQVKLAAGQLIEKAGWRGHFVEHSDGRSGGFGVHKDQALVLVNHAASTGSEVYALSEEVLRSVHSKFGVELEREVNIL